jgi:hypothetical protein
MRCDAARAFLSRLSNRDEPVPPTAPTDLDYLSGNGYILKASKQDYDERVDNVAKLSQMIEQLRVEQGQADQAAATLQQSERKEHSFMFHFEGKEEKDELRETIQRQTADASREEAESREMGEKVNELIQEKSMTDRMVPYDGGYLALTDLGKLVLNDLNIRNYRAADQDFPDFLTEIKATYAELRSIADTATYHVLQLRREFPELEETHASQDSGSDERGQPGVEAPSLLWSVSIGLSKLRGDPSQIGERFAEAFRVTKGLDSTTANKLMAAEVITAIGGQDIQSLGSALNDLDQQLRRQHVPDEQRAGVSATILAGRRYDGTYPIDRFPQSKRLTPSYEAASILAILNVPYDGLATKFQVFRSMFRSWGYMASEDTEVASAFLAIGELNPDEVEEKLRYIVEQLKNYLEYPLVAAAILASIPVFESHEVLDLMEKEVTLLSGYARGLERSELVALAVRTIHGVRNELVREIDSTARITPTPIQFTYPPHPGFFVWYRPVIIAHSFHFSTFGGMGGFHPAHSHGVGGFAG